MAMVVKVRFKRAGKFYDFDPNGAELHTGMKVITETVRGIEMGECMSGVLEIDDGRINFPLKPIVRVATAEDIETQRRNEQREKEAFAIAEERIAEHKLEMKLVDVEYAFDHSKITFYFTANGRVDFRMLVKNLAAIFKTRIELRQIGVRDEAKMLGGIGPCGRPICCQSFLSELTPVTIKMAKEQNLSLNPTKISGLCDKLIVGVTVDELVSYKGKRAFIPFEDRIEIVRSCQYVDAAVPQYDLDKVAACRKLGASILFVGDDWYGTEKWQDWEEELSEEGVRVVYFPYTRGISSTKINAALAAIRDRD